MYNPCLTVTGSTPSMWVQYMCDKTPCRVLFYYSPIHIELYNIYLLITSLALCNLYSMKIIDSPACSCGFVNKNEFHFLLVCPLFNRP